MCDNVAFLIKIKTWFCKGWVNLMLSEKRRATNKACVFFNDYICLFFNDDFLNNLG